MADVQEIVVTRPEELPACCEYMAQCGQFGLDTEFVGEDTYHPHLCLVQVAAGERLYLIDPLTVGPLDAFWNLVTDPANVVVVHAGREEIRLCRISSGRTPGNLFDLQIAAGLVGMSYPMGHAALVGQLLGVPLSKGETLTEWRDRPLTPAQIRYAFDDVRYLLALWKRLANRLEKLGRSDWAREEFERLASQVAPDDPAAASAERWRKLRGLGSLDRRRLAVVRELYLWREATAERTNRPARSICRDDLLAEIARRNPTRERDLHSVRGLPRRDLPGILEAVQRARALPIDECPVATGREQDPPQVTLASNVLSAVLGDFCARNHLAPNLVASGNDLKLLIRGQLQNGEAAETTTTTLVQGWRGQHVLPTLRAVLDGRHSVRIADLSSEAPLAYVRHDAPTSANSNV